MVIIKSRDPKISWIKTQEAIQPKTITETVETWKIQLIRLIAGTQGSSRQQHWHRVNNSGNWGSGTAFIREGIGIGSHKGILKCNLKRATVQVSTLGQKLFFPSKSWILTKVFFPSLLWDSMKLTCSLGEGKTCQSRGHHSSHSPCRSQPHIIGSCASLSRPARVKLWNLTEGTARNSFFNSYKYLTVHFYQPWQWSTCHLTPHPSLLLPLQIQQQLHSRWKSWSSCWSWRQVAKNTYWFSSTTLWYEVGFLNLSSEFRAWWCFRYFAVTSVPLVQPRGPSWVSFLCFITVLFHFWEKSTHIVWKMRSLGAAIKRSDLLIFIMFISSS